MDGADETEQKDVGGWSGRDGLDERMGRPERLDELDGQTNADGRAVSKKQKTLWDKHGSREKAVQKTSSLEISIREAARLNH